MLFCNLKNSFSFYRKSSILIHNSLLLSKIPNANLSEE